MLVSRRNAERRFRGECLEPRQLLTTLLPGDYNDDGIVDVADYTVWRDTLEQSAAAPGEGADGNRNGVIDVEDHIVWQTNFGKTAPDDPSDPPAPNWFDEHILDEALASLGSSRYVDGLIDRDDILALFDSAQDEDVIDAVELADLRAMVEYAPLFGELEHVWKLSSYVVAGNSANGQYQGAPLGDLVEGASGSNLQQLVNKWFLGLDRPQASGEYREIAGTLFVEGASYVDIDQAGINDCAFLASLAVTAQREPATIESMFVVNGDGTYTVRFYHEGVAEFVTVDSYLPTDGGGNLVYARTPENELWVALAEKAYVQACEMSWFGAQTNAYASIEFLYAYATLGHVSGRPTAGLTYVTGGASQSLLVRAWEAGSLICLVSQTDPPVGGIVSNHAYAVVDYDATSETVTLFNPWGINEGLLTLGWNEVQTNFYYFDRTV